MNKGLPNKISQLRSFSAQAREGTLNLGLGKPYEDMPDPLRELAATMLINKNFRQDYSENAGFAGVRGLLEEHYHLPKGCTILTHGSQEGIYSVLATLLNPGDEVLIPNPGFVAYEPMVRMNQGKTKAYPLKKIGTSFEYDLDLILKSLSPKTKIVILNSPANPSGSLVHHSAVSALAKVLKKRGIFIVSDEVYAELDYSEPYVPLCLYGPNIISVNSFSKSHALTGWRIGWAACTDPKVMAKILVAHQYISTCASVPAQHLIRLLLSDNFLFESIRDQYCADYLLKRDIFFKALGKAAESFTRPQAGFYAFLPIPKKFSSSLKFASSLLAQKNILVIPGEFFGSAGKKFVRVSYSAKNESLKVAGETISKYY